MNKSETEVIRNIIRRLKCSQSQKHTVSFGTPSYGECEKVRYALTGSIDPDRILSDEEAERLIQQLPDYWQDRARRERFEDAHAEHMPRLYLQSWVIGALASLLDEEDGGTGRDLELAVSLSR